MTVKKTFNNCSILHKSTYRALAAAISDILWLHRLLTEFKLKLSLPTTIHYDNISTISLANNPFLHARTMHIVIDHHFIHQQTNCDYTYSHHQANYRHFYKSTIKFKIQPAQEQVDDL